MKAWHIGIAMLVVSGSATAVMHQDPVIYKDGDTELKGYVFWDDAFTGNRPGILVMHARWGLNDYAKLRAEMLAETGYVAFAADMYGDARVTRHANEANGWKQAITADSSAWQHRAELALEQLKNHPKVDSKQLAAIGYGFGGTTVMQLAYAGNNNLDAVVSFHGPFLPATPEQATKVKARVLIAHGDADRFVSADRMEVFKKALSGAHVNWEIDIYGNAQHGFTNPYADGYGIDGLAYNEGADRRSWLRMLAYFEEVFGDTL